MAYPYFVPDHLVVAPPFQHIECGLVKHVNMRGEEFMSFSYHPLQDSMLLSYMRQTTGSLVLDKLMVVSFHPSADGGFSYIKDILKRGICLEGVSYRFLSTTPNPTSGRKTWVLVSETDLVIYDFLDRFINFSQVKSVPYRAECLGLLMNGFKKTVSLKYTDCAVVKDIEKGKYNFTQGCGFMSREFAAEIQIKEGLQFHPCAVFGIYQGFYGALVIGNDIERKVEFRESMKKFTVSDEDLRNTLTTFAVLDYSRPYTNGYLNIQSVMLLADRGVSRDYLKQLQEDYYTMLENLCTNRSRAAYFLKTTGNTELLRILQSSDPQAIQTELEKLRKAETLNMKHCDQLDGGRQLPQSNHCYETWLRVLVPKSRIVLGVCDPYGKLKSGECYFSPTMSDEEEGEYLAVQKVVVLHSPCYHSGDICVLHIRRKQPEYSYLKDCIVFPTEGTSPHFLQCGGANLAGSKFFVTWDTNLVPRWNEAPFDYSPSTPQLVSKSAKAALSRLGHHVRSRARDSLPSVLGDRHSFQERKKVKVLQELVGHFAEASNVSLCKLDSTFMKYAALVGPSSKECRHIHRHLVNALSGQTKDGDLEKVLEKYDHKLQAYETHEELPRSSTVQRVSVRLGLTRPVFQRGDDVWEAMELRAKDFVHRMSASLASPD